jgi:enamine deaminase RidA (YjgF/YER057c/UK114 family)
MKKKFSVLAKQFFNWKWVSGICALAVCVVGMFSYANAQGVTFPTAVTYFGSAGEGARISGGVPFRLDRLVSTLPGRNAPVPATSSIASGAAIPAGRALYFSSGTVPPSLDSLLPTGVPAVTAFAGQDPSPNQPGVVPVFYDGDGVPPTSDPRRYGTTEEQAVNTLRRIQALLTAQGLSFDNVVYLTAFLTPDPYLRTRFVYDSRGNRILQAVPRSEIDEAFANGLRPDDEDFPGEPTYDYQGWFRAYARFFDKDNPNRAGTFSSATAITRSPRLAVAPAPEPGATAVKTARSTVGLPGLVVPGWLIEIEAIAAYPER